MQNYEKLKHKLVETKAQIALWDNSETAIQFTFLYGKKSSMGLLDGDQIIIGVRRALRVLELVVQSKESSLLFVNTRPETESLVKKIAQETHQSYVIHKWVGGTLTNWSQFCKVQNKFLLLSKEFGHLLETQNIYFPRYQKMKHRFEGFSYGTKMPNLLIVLNPTQNQMAIREAVHCKIPIIAFVDSNTPSNLMKHITYPIPGNFESISFVYWCLNCMTKIIKRNKLR